LKQLRFTTAFDADYNQFQPQGGASNIERKREGTA